MNPPDPTTPPAILYIMGTGRSGSTILEIVLAHAASTHGAGELFDVIEDGLERNVTCSCGQPFNQCELWLPVSQALQPYRSHLAETKAMMRGIEWHHGFWGQWLNRRPLPAQYKDFNDTLFKTLHQHTGRATVIDSSKFAGRALALHRLYGSRVKVVWLVRSPAGILHSFRKPNNDEQRPKGLLKAAAYVAYVALCCRLARGRLGDSCLPMHYESIMAAPADELKRLADWSGLDLADAIGRLGAGEPFTVGHLLTANRIRKLGRVRWSPAGRVAVASRAQRFVAALLDGWYALLGMRAPETTAAPASNRPAA